MGMSIQQLYYAITIADKGSFNKAAEVLYVSQPSLTSSMQELEKDLGVTLFHRSGRGVTLTNDGVEFINHARHIYQQYDQLLSKYGKGEKLKKKFGISTQHYSFAVKSFVEMVKHAKRYIVNPRQVDRERLLQEWRRNIMLLKNEERELWQTPYDTNREQALALGVELIVDGELPDKPQLRNVIDTAISVHVANTLRHAEGDKAYIEVSETEDSYVLVFTNNGKPPQGPLRETGGLGNLRRETESTGGSMEVRSTPVFAMKLILPKEEKENGI